MPRSRVPKFAVISGRQVRDVLAGQEKRVIGLVEEAYRMHGRGETVNPPSYFLRFPDRPEARIIALPASLGGAKPVDGLKWISSFPGNVSGGIPRASAVLVLNDHHTGYPLACLEASIISATRTAASAAVAADWLTRGRRRPRRIGFFGNGLIARYVHTYLTAAGWSFDEVGVHDLSPAHIRGFLGYLSRAGESGRISAYERAEDLVRSADLVVFATVAGAPHVHDVTWFDHHPLVLHISLRDLAPRLLLVCANVLDDVEHCLTAGTSAHRAEQLAGNRDFVAGTLYDAMAGRLWVPGDQPVIFSPFGLGVLDLAVGRHVYHETASRGELNLIEDFFCEVDRYGGEEPSCK